MSALAVGDVVAEREVHLTRASLVAYANASGDQNPIHQDDEVAAAVGLPGVIAHGMLTMGLAVQPVVDWVAALRLGPAALPTRRLRVPERGPQGRVEGPRITDYGVRFTRMVVVDADSGAHVRIVAKVGALDPEAGTARIDLTVTSGDEAVLGKAQVAVRGLEAVLRPAEAG